MLSERRDVEILEGRSLAAFFYALAGKKDEKLSEERKEYYAARVKYEAARRELEAIETDLESTREDLADLADCEERYANAIEEKRNAIENAGNALSRDFLEKKQNLNHLKYLEKDLEEAIAAGTNVLRIASDVMNSLRNVENLGYLDRLGHNPLTDMAKHETLDEAQKNVESLQVELQKFNKELSDIPSRDSLQGSIDRMLKFSDDFFENLFMDATVPERLRQSYAQVEHALDPTLGILRQLQTRLEEVRHNQLRAKAEVDALILEIEL
jgi:chromosome segregation ATPase